MVVAAGSGTRLGADRPKAFVDLDGRSLLWHAVRRVESAVLPDGSPVVTSLVVVAPAGHLTAARLEVARAWRPGEEAVVVLGGAERGESVRAGLAALPPDVDVVLVHDAARCLTPPGLFARVAGAVREGARAVVPGLPVVDTVKQVALAAGPPWPVVTTPVRDELRAVQTPQGFDRAGLQQAHESAEVGGEVATDDAGLVERFGGKVWVVPGEQDAFKITTPEDLGRARRMLDAGVSA